MTTAQAPIGSGFGFSSTADDVLEGIDLTGRLALVTGGYSGIGTETTRALVRAGATFKNGKLVEHDDEKGAVA